MKLYRYILLLACYSQFSHASVNLGSSTGIFGKFTSFFQTIVDFLGGAGTLFVVFIGASAAIGLWVFAPKEASVAIAWLFRICVGAILLFSLGTFITWLGSF
ncbi:hypothetical protein DYB89_14660 [Vibrio cholerae]|nr:hypothetical protein [Vibrio cholerae]